MILNYAAMIIFASDHFIIIGIVYLAMKNSWNGGPFCGSRHHICELVHMYFDKVI